MEKLKDPWLIAAWPGMGLVGHLAVDHLARALMAEPMSEIPPEDHFDLTKVEVKNGILVPRPMPRTLLSVRRGSNGERDLLILESERQPESRAHRFCERVLGIAQELGVVRVFTFAAMAMPTPPDAPSRVFGAATDVALANELRGFGVELLPEGEIGGMNGVLLATAAERSLPGASLLGEFPFFASGVPNPKASASILRAFSRISGLRIDLSKLDAQAVEVEKQLTAYVKHLEEVARSRATGEREAGGKEVHEEWPAPQREETPSPEEKDRIESLFRAAEGDRSKAIQLKAELDRLGVFRRYEDRFLDLFKRAE
jgi:proteasome assembly chaperone (PAC2) family protein